MIVWAGSNRSSLTPAEILRTIFFANAYSNTNSYTYSKSTPSSRSSNSTRVHKNVD